MNKLYKTLSVMSILAFASTMASAANMKTYPGSICKAYHGTDASKVSFTSGTITTKAGVSIECPVLRDEPHSTKGVGVSIWGTKGGQTLGCSFRDTAFGGSNIKYYSMGQATTSGDFNLGVGVARSSAYGNYSFYCSAPSGVTIKQIRVTEDIN